MLFYNFHRISFFLYFLGDRKSMRFMLKPKKRYEDNNDLGINEHCLSRSENKAWKKIQTCIGVEPMTYAVPITLIFICLSTVKDMMFINSQPLYYNVIGLHAVLF